LLFRRLKRCDWALNESGAAGVSYHERLDFGRKFRIVPMSVHQNGGLLRRSEFNNLLEKQPDLPVAFNRHRISVESDFYGILRSTLSHSAQIAPTLHNTDNGFRFEKHYPAVE
jgi:hypothetical protein